MPWSSKEIDVLNLSSDSTHHSRCFAGSGIRVIQVSMLGSSSLKNVY